MSLTYTSDRQVLQEMVNGIIAEVDPEQIMLFGSRARGEARPVPMGTCSLLNANRLEKLGADGKKPFVYGEP